MSISKSDSKKILERASQHIFSTGVEDSATELAKANMQFGLAKMHLAQEHYGLEPDATFISSPDETITRNKGRWNQGIGYGGKISWGAGREKLMVLDVKPNACGMLVGGIDKVPEPKELLKTIYEFEKDDTFIKNVKVQWDFNKGNHFIDVFNVEGAVTKLPDHIVILHAGCPEMKTENQAGHGLYFDNNPALQQIADTIKTPFGPIYCLEGRNADEYFKFWNFADEFAKKRREIAFKAFFGGKIICNRTHQGLVNMNEIALGCHVCDDFKGFYPFSIRADLPSYLLRAKKNFTDNQIEELGFAERAEEFGVTGRLKKANLLPHGGGYTFNDSLSVDRIFEVNKLRYFSVDMLDGVGKKIISDPRDVQYSYRGREVLLKTLEIGMGEELASLRPIYTLKV
ncbi:hypothetical protein GF345_00515 [Candidatus Woesearchaeota archaeon]|nr:hypothetical protein [Candidatus Woesearchaeota archaeon]